MTCLFVVVLGLCQCSTVNPNPVDYKALLLGNWEGRAYSDERDNQLVMYVTFDAHNMTVDYSPSNGARFTEPYKISGDRTIEASRYPEHLIIQRQSDNEIKFSSDSKRLRKDIEMIYVCKFTRVVK